MDSELRDLETELKAMCPRPLSEGFAAGLEQRQQRCRRWRWQRLYLAAAALLLVVGVAFALLNPWRPSAPPERVAAVPPALPKAPTVVRTHANGAQAGTLFEPVAAGTRLIARELHPVRDWHGLTVRPVTLKFEDRFRWRSDDGRQVFEFSAPREEMVLVRLQPD